MFFLVNTAFELLLDDKVPNLRENDKNAETLMQLYSAHICWKAGIGGEDRAISTAGSLSNGRSQPDTILTGEQRQI